MAVTSGPVTSSPATSSAATSSAAPRRRDEQDRHWAGLMRAAQDGDAGAYGELLRDLLPVLRILTRRHGIGPENVEDVVQDVLLTIHRVRHTYDPARPLLPWVAAITHRRAIDASRRRGRVTRHEESASDRYETYSDPDANRGLDAREHGDWLARAVAALPPKQREALRLVKLQEMSIADASSASGQTPGAVKVNVHRALATLRALMAREG